MRLVDLREHLDDMARAQPDPDHDGGRRSVAGRVRRHRRRTRLTSLAAVIVIAMVGVVSLRAGGADRPPVDVDVGVTSGSGPFPHLVPGYVPGGLLPAYETFDSAGHQIQSAEGLLPPMAGPGYAIVWGAADDSGRVDPTSPGTTFLSVLSAPLDLDAFRAEHRGSRSVVVAGGPGVVAPLSDSSGGWVVVWLPEEGGTALVSRPCADGCPPDEALEIASSVRPVDQLEWQRFLSQETTAPPTTTTSPPP
jgi:hypothetical protein